MKPDAIVNGRAIEFKTMDFARVEQKVLRHAQRYGTGAAQLAGAHFHTMFHDELQYVLGPRHERIDSSAGLDDNEKRWAAAFRKVYNVGKKFYEAQPAKARAKLQEQYTELAKKGRGIAAQRAAEVLAVVAEYALEGKVPGPKPLQFQGGMTGRVQGTGALQSIPKHDDQLDAYRFLFQNLPYPLVKP